MFNDVIVHRRDENGNLVKRIKVPISYGPKAKFLTRLKQDPELMKAAAISLPRLSFQIVNYNYDPTRKLSTLGKIQSTGADDTTNKTVYNPVPWNIDIELVAYVLNAEDGTQIIEQILPFFTPEWVNTMKLLDDPEVKLDVPVVLNTLVTEDNYEDTYENRRYIYHTFNFTLKGYLFGPVRDKKVILGANTRVYVPGYGEDLNTVVAGANDYFEYTFVRPGLLANGEPTTNAALSVPANTISANDNWDYIVTTTVNPDFFVNNDP
jgi:hypothetical protein